MKNAIITGGTKGMGRAITIALVKQNINVSICSRNAAELDTFKKKDGSSIFLKLISRLIQETL